MLLMDHLPECPAPLCDYFDPKGKCMGYEDCEHLCCCAALRACEQRVLVAAKEAVDSMVIETAGNSAATVDQAVAAIDALREKR